MGQKPQEKNQHFFSFSNNDRRSCDGAKLSLHTSIEDRMVRKGSCGNWNFISFLLIVNNIFCGCRILKKWIIDDQSETVAQSARKELPDRNRTKSSNVKLDFRGKILHQKNSAKNFTPGRFSKTFRCFLGCLELNNGREIKKNILQRKSRVGLYCRKVPWLHPEKTAWNTSWRYHRILITIIN